MPADRDRNQAFARRLLAARKRALRHLMRALERQALQLAIEARQAGARARRSRRLPPFNPVTQLKREIMPLVAQLAELAAGAALPPQPQQYGPPQRRRSRRKAEHLGADEA
jgi:hypothetical protein